MITAEAAAQSDTRAAGATAAKDRGRWFTLATVVTAVLIVALDMTVLNVAIPTILRDFRTTLSSLQWVITGYSLTFATLLIVRGRLGDIYGARRVFVVGAALFGMGSFLASVSRSVPVLVLGEAVIEGIGASLMLPSTLAILSTTFQGTERAAAFAVWGATSGVAVALGPVVGGFLTTHYSWRWAFRINVVVAPLAILGALAFMRPSPRGARGQRTDVPGALLIATGMCQLVFGLSEGPRYGWLEPPRDLTLGGRRLWPATAPVSAIPFVFAIAAALLIVFVVVERRKERRDADPLFEFGQLQQRGFRYGLITTMVLAMGQLSFIFVLPVFLQDALHLSASDNGLWLLPSGVMIIVAAHTGARLTRWIGTTATVRLGLAFEALGLLVLALVLSPHTTFLSLLAAFVVFGTGAGFASSQLTNVILAEIPDERAGAASGANTTVRQIGAALGIAIMSAILATRHNVAVGARTALLFACTVVAIGTALSLLIPRIGPMPHEEGAQLAGAYDAFDLVDPADAVEHAR